MKDGRYLNSIEIISQAESAKEGTIWRNVELSNDSLLFAWPVVAPINSERIAILGGMCDTFETQDASGM